MNFARKVYNWVRKRILGIDDRSQLEIAIENGLSVGKNIAVMGEVIIDPGHCWLISIGDDVTLAPRVHLLAHDASTKRELGYVKIGKVSIGNNVFIGAGTIILPNVHIGNNVVVGAGSVVTKDIPENSVAVGNPARVIEEFRKYMEKNHNIMEMCPVFDESYRIGEITAEKREEMKNRLETGVGFVV